ncbi:P-loop NTPase fold protein [Leifsonia sp. F6_8S_P_1B]|uniref:P-loop NTPase fold protein n=1 Tax=Leifsonia williamsii TaxID=3035919 RepID=A0ABT8K862_9MICO|nr:P-loop NTPase fold protein [Leifsonia williamsii]MDN4613183.1 P-loop NTPase fold protein [Leifsonia williamsii]
MAWLSRRSLQECVTVAFYGKGACSISGVEEEDRFNRGALLGELVKQVLGNAATHDRARFVAIVGSWGSGKTWILDRVRGDLGGHTREFNPWLFSDELSLYRGFAAFLLERIQDRRARKRMATALDYLGPSMKGLGFDVSGTAMKAASALRGLDSPSSIREELRKSFSKNAGPAYVLVDDLDRLTPEELLLFFKLIRLIGDVPGLVYVLAYDEEALLELLARTPIAGSRERARQYLEKIVERKVYVPRMSHSQWSNEVLVPLVDFGLATHPMYAADEDAQEEFVWRMESFGWQMLPTPRIAARFLDSVMALPQRLHGEVNFLDWCLICLLRVSYPGVWQLVANHPDVFAGVSAGFRLRTLNDGNKVLARQVVETIESVVGATYQREDVLEILDYLFPNFAADRKEAPSARTYSSGTRQRIGDPAFFDRYFAYALPPGEVSDVVVNGLLARLDLAEEASRAAGELRALFSAAPEATMNTMRRRWETAVSVEALYPFLSELADAPELSYRTGPFGVRGETQLLSFAEEVLRLGSQTFLDGLDFARAQALNPLDVGVLLDEAHPSGSRHYVDWIEAQRSLLEERAARELQSAVSPLSDRGVDEWFDRLRRLNPERLLRIEADALASERWSADEIAGANVTWSITSRRPNPTLDRVRVAALLSNDQSMVSMLRKADPGPYPAAWDADPASVDIVDVSLSQVGSYVLRHWDEATSADWG